MLVVKIELWPGGDESRKREICRGEIANVLPENDAQRFSVGEYTTDWIVDGKRRIRGIGVSGFWRHLGALELVARCLSLNSGLGRLDIP